MAQRDDSRPDPPKTVQEQEDRQTEDSKVLLGKHGGASTHSQYLDRDRVRKRDGDEGQSQ